MMRKLLIVISISFFLPFCFSLTNEQVALIDKIANKTNLTETEKIILYSLFNKSFQNYNSILYINNLLSNLNNSLTNRINNLNNSLTNDIDYLKNNITSLNSKLNDMEIIFNSKIYDIEDELNLTKKEINLIYSLLNISKDKENNKNFEKELSLILLNYLLNNKNNENNENNNNNKENNKDILELLDKKLDEINQEIDNKIEAKLSSLDYLEDKINSLSKEIEKKNTNNYLYILLAPFIVLLVLIYYMYNKLNELNKKINTRRVDLSKIETNFENIEEETTNKKIKKW